MIETVTVTQSNLRVDVSMTNSEDRRNKSDRRSTEDHMLNLSFAVSPPSRRCNDLVLWAEPDSKYITFRKFRWAGRKICFRVARLEDSTAERLRHR